MNNPNQTIDEVKKEISLMNTQQKDEWLVILNAGNLTKQQYIEGLEVQLAKLEAQIEKDRRTKELDGARSLTDTWY